MQIGSFSILLCAGLVGCAPALNWRECHPEGAALQLMFPCKPELLQRAAAGPQPAMGMAACEADGQRYALSWVVVSDPRHITSTLSTLRGNLGVKLGARGRAWQTLVMPGMSTNEAAGSERLEGKQQQARAAWFTRGLHVYQLVQLGVAADENAWQQFLASVKPP